MSTNIASADRAFFELVSEAVFSNPFGDRRHAIDLRLAEVTGATERYSLLANVVGRVDARLAGLRTDGALRLDDLSAVDRPLVERAILFSAFHELADPIDEHIEQQRRAGSTLCATRYPRMLIERLCGHGFALDHAIRMVGLFFQMRRAFYFIDRTVLGTSACMRALRQSLWNNIFTYDIGRYDRWLWSRMEDFSTILLGDTGTGKGTAAAAIGQAGFIPYDESRGRFVESFADAFLAVNLSQFSAGLLESELFGHVKGAFTGAVERYAGAFARCSAHGAIFLDEIGEVGVPVQIKLLRVLQEREFFAVGSHKAERFSGRVIAATHADLDERRQSGHFRDDFYYRLCSDVIVVPTLRQRIAEDPQELRVLVGAVVERTVGERAPELVASVLDAIARELPPDYDWPGNVRELEQCVRRVLMTRRYTGHVQAAGGSARAQIEAALDTGSLSARVLVQQYCCLLYERHGTYEEVARRTGLDRRTVKRHIVEAGSENSDTVCA